MASAPAANQIPLLPARIRAVMTVEIPVAMTAETPPVVMTAAEAAAIPAETATMIPAAEALAAIPEVEALTAGTMVPEAPAEKDNDIKNNE